MLPKKAPQGSAVDPAQNPNAPTQSVPSASNTNQTGKERIAATYKNIKSAYLRRGFTEEQAEAFARGGAAQAAQESGWGKKSKSIGQNNIYNIKETDTQKGDVAGTVGYDTVTRKTDTYAGYSTPEKAADAYVEFLMKNKR